MVLKADYSEADKFTRIGKSNLHKSENKSKVVKEALKNENVKQKTMDFILNLIYWVVAISVTILFVYEVGFVKSIYYSIGLGALVYFLIYLRIQYENRKYNCIKDPDGSITLYICVIFLIPILNVILIIMFIFWILDDKLRRKR